MIFVAKRRNKIFLVSSKQAERQKQGSRKRLHSKILWDKEEPAIRRRNKFLLVSSK